MNLITHPISRRRLMQVGGAAALGVALRPGIRLAEAAGGRELEVLGAGYPRAIVFRQAEVLANLRSYEEWEAAFMPLSGILGKVLFEERTDTVTDTNAEYFAQFKTRNPDKLVIAHVNGQGCLESYVGDDWWPGFWLYRPGSPLTADLGAGDTTAPVADTAWFRLNREVFGESWADLVISSVDGSGRPDFQTWEYVRMNAIDEPDSELTIERGQNGSTATAFDAGAYVAQIVNGGRWSQADGYVWAYNLATVAPTDPLGRQAADALIDLLAARFTGAGDLAGIDGIEFDAFTPEPVRRLNCDADLDGVADQGVIDGLDVYEVGALDYIRRVREMLGPDRILLTDGGKLQRPAPTEVNGIETEGFPSTTDPDLVGWSQALNILAFWSAHHHPPGVRYPLYKFRPPHPDPYGRFRLALAAALFTDSDFSFYDEPHGDGSLIGITPGSPDAGNFPNQFMIWDELIAGRRNKPGWLGGPKGPARHLAEDGPDLLAGDGVNLTPAFMAQLDGTGVRFKRRGSSPPQLVVKPRGERDELEFAWSGLDAPEGDLILAFDLKATPRPEYPASTPRRLAVTAIVGGGPDITHEVFAPADWFHVVLSFRDVGSGPLQFAFAIDGGEEMRMRGIRAHEGPDAMCRGFKKGAVFANPSSAPHTFDVAALFPGRSFKRIRGTADQDPATNDGSPIGASLTLPALDALLVANA